jgi:hypothetical protein
MVVVMPPYDAKVFKAVFQPRPPPDPKPEDIEVV